MKPPIKLGAFAITHERALVLRDTIVAIDSQAVRPEVIWVVDNSASRETEALIQGWNRPDLRYHRMGRNAGPAGAAAQGLQLLFDEGYEWAYWIDDDDPPRRPDTLSRLVGLIEAHGGSTLGGVGAVGHRFSWRTGQLERLPDEALEGALQVDVIGGGQHFIVSTRAAAAVGGPCPDLFFSGEDLEFCLRLRRAGFELLVDGDHMLELRRFYGRLHTQRRRRLFPQLPREALWREYYSNRNYIHMMNTTFGRGDLARRWVARSLLKTLASCVRGPRYAVSFSGVTLLSIVDAYRGKMGLVIPPVSKGVAGRRET